MFSSAERSWLSHRIFRLGNSQLHTEFTIASMPMFAYHSPGAIKMAAGIFTAFDYDQDEFYCMVRTTHMLQLDSKTFCVR
jgi:hypothetical protein